MTHLEIYESIQKDIAIWIEKEKKYKLANMLDFFSLLKKIDIKTSLKYRHEDTDEPIFIHHFQEIATYTNIPNRILDLELWLNTKYGLKEINRIKKTIIKSLLNFHKYYPETFLNKRELNLLLKEYNFILIAILVQLNI